jgi:cytoskeleton protein RodZ
MAKGSFGEILKRERELREVTLYEVTLATRIPTRLLEAFEQEQWDKLPGGFFDRGFLRAIARFLGLGEEQLLAEYDAARGPIPSKAAGSRANFIPRPSKAAVAAVALGALLIVVAILAGGVYEWRKYSARRALTVPVPASEPSVDAPPVLPNLMVEPGAALPTVLPTATSDISGPLDLAVSTSAATRIRISGDGKLLLDRKLAAGETRHFSAGQNFEVHAANSSAVVLELNGQTMPPLGTGRASGTMMLSQKDLKQVPNGSAQP